MPEPAPCGRYGIVGAMSSSCARCGAAAGAGARFCAACGAPLEAPGGPGAQAGDGRLRRPRRVDRSSSPGATPRTPATAGAVHRARARGARGARRPGGEVHRRRRGGRLRRPPRPRRRPRPRGRRGARARRPAERGGRAARAADRDRGGRGAGQPRERRPRVTGEPTHAAARLQQAAAPGRDPGRRAAAGAVRSAELDGPRAIAAAGFPEPLRAWRATGRARRRPARRHRSSAAAASSRRCGSPTCGRSASASPTWPSSSARPGAGKTRLVRELIGELRGRIRRPLLLIGRNPPYGRRHRLLGARRAPPRRRGSARRRRRERVREELAARLAGARSDRTPRRPRRRWRRRSRAPASDRRGGARRAWRRLLASSRDERPVLIAVDDAHWADEGFLELVEASATLPARPVLIVCTARPEIAARGPLGAGRRPPAARARAAAAAAAEELAAQLVAGADPALAPPDRGDERRKPFFTEEIAHAMADRGEPPPGTAARHRAGGDRLAPRRAPRAREASRSSRPRCSATASGARR